MKDYVRWCVSERELDQLSPERARDLIVKCFQEAQRETFARARESLGARQDEDALKRSLVHAVRLAFQEAGYDFDHPTMEGLMEVVETLTRKAQSWGTPPDIIEHHRSEIGRVLDALALSV